jgi:hypothetical protein
MDTSVFSLRGVKLAGPDGYADRGTSQGIVGNLQERRRQKNSGNGGHIIIPRISWSLSQVFAIGVQMLTLSLLAERRIIVFVPPGRRPTGQDTPGSADLGPGTVSPGPASTALRGGELDSEGSRRMNARLAGRFAGCGLCLLACPAHITKG